MNLLFELFSFIMHVDKYLLSLLQDYGPWIYLILFLIIFVETGVVVMPFLPGDSLLFVAGTLAGVGSLNVFLLFVILTLAAIIGDSVNYSIGKYLGKKALEQGKIKWIKHEHLKKTQEFYDKHGGKTIIIARFMPFVRTFAPFVAGIGKMNYLKFLFYNVTGAIIWVALFIFGGYFFGNIPSVKENLTIVVILIIILSILPGIIHYLKTKFRKNK